MPDNAIPVTSRGNRDASGVVALGFETDTVTIPIAMIVALRSLREGIKESHNYKQIAASIKAIGLVEAPVVIPDRSRRGYYLLLDGHLRIEALKEAGVEEVACLISLDDEAYTYNKRINRLLPIQEHRMVMRAISRGVSASAIAEALGLEILAVKRRVNLLNGICPQAAELLKTSPLSMAGFDCLKQMNSARQIESAELMIGQSNYSLMFARALLAATPPEGLAKPSRLNQGKTAKQSRLQLARMERELASLQLQVKTVEDTYGIDNLNLTIVRGYLGRLLANPKVARWLMKNRGEYLDEFKKIAEVDDLIVSDETDCFEKEGEGLAL